MILSNDSNIGDDGRVLGGKTMKSVIKTHNVTKRLYTEFDSGSLGIPIFIEVPVESKMEKYIKIKGYVNRNDLAHVLDKFDDLVKAEL